MRGAPRPISSLSPTATVMSPMEPTMKRKPDLIMVLMLLFGIGVVATGYAQTLVGS